MKQIVTAFFMMFLLLIQIGISNGIIFADTQVTTAERYHQNIIAEIEAGNLSDAVIDTCKAKATADRYVLQTDKIVAVSYTHLIRNPWKCYSRILQKKER